MATSCNTSKPRAGVARVYEHIVADRLHHGIIELVREPIAAREFSDWTMAFRSISAFGLSSPDKFDDLFLAKIDPGSCRPFGDAQLAVEVLEQGRHAGQGWIAADGRPAGC